MGSQPSKDIEYSIAITDEHNDQSAIYRNPLVKDSLLQKPDTSINTLQDAIIRSFQQYHDREFLGFWDPKSEGTLNYKTYSEIQVITRKLGSAIVSLQLAY